MTMAGLRSQKLPVVALVAPGHFVLVEAMDEKDGGVRLWDPQSGAGAAKQVSGAEWPKLWMQSLGATGNSSLGAAKGAGYALTLTSPEMKTLKTASNNLPIIGAGGN